MAFQGAPRDQPASTCKSILIVIFLSLGPAVANGFARFAYALLLPSMRDSFDWSYSTAGLLNTANAIGYIAGSIFVLFFVGRTGNRGLYSVGITATSVTLIATGLTSDFEWLMLWRFLAGAFGAAVFISGSALVSGQTILHSRVRSFAIPLYFGGAGIGIVLSAIGIPLVLTWMGQGAWRESWLAMGGLSIAFSVLSVFAALQCHDPSSVEFRRSWNWQVYRLGIISYFVYGCGYITYMTFIIAWMRSSDAGVVEVATFWALLGMAVIASPYVWRSRLEFNKGGISLGLAGFVLSAASILPYLSPGFVMMHLSALLFGLSMFIGPAAVTVMVKNGSEKPSWGVGIAAFTTAFGLGQAIGPVASGWIGDVTGSLSLAISASSLILAIGGVFAMMQKDVRVAG